MAVKDLIDSEPAKKAKPGAKAAGEVSKPRPGDRPT
jgi:hypothetical protein